MHTILPFTLAIGLVSIVIFILWRELADYICLKCAKCGECIEYNRSFYHNLPFHPECLKEFKKNQ